MTGPVDPPDRGLDVEALVARVLHIGTLAAMALLVIGVVLMLASGVDPLTAQTVPFDASTLVGDILALRAAGFLWLGIVLVIVLPIGRVALELAGATVRRDHPMILISGGILVVVLIAIGIAFASPASGDASSRWTS